MHKYLHDMATPLSWRPSTVNTGLEEIIKREPQLKQILGADPADEIISAAKELQACLVHLR